MHKKYLILICVSAVLLTAAQTFSQSLKLPYKDAGACPFECCTYRDWFARKPITLFKRMDDRSPIAFKIKKSEKVRGVTGVVVTFKPGIAEALKSLKLDNSKISVRKGDKLLLLTYKGEGFYLFWYKGIFFDEDANIDGLKVLSQPNADWWVKIRNRKGQIGWTKASDAFDNQDQCG